MGWFIAGCGAFAVSGAACNWDWFMNHRKARFFVAVFGRNGARVAYGVLGVGLVVLGALIAAGIIESAK